MNKFQLSALIGGFANALLMVLFPPYDRTALGRIEPRFDAFHFVLQPPAGQTINAGVLALELLAVALVVILALFFLRGSRGDPAYPPRRPRSVVFSLAAVLLTLILIFPPFETMPLSRIGAATFYGFDIAFGGGVQRGIFVPMLFLELLLLGINFAVFWLLFDVMDRNNRRAADARPLERRSARPAAPLDAAHPHPIGRSGEERRSHRDPAYQGPERRRGRERRAG